MLTLTLALALALTLALALALALALINKHPIACLRWRGHDDHGGGGGGGGGAHIAAVLGRSDTLLEALGNARTVNNHNSSRFAKHLQLGFRRSDGGEGGGGREAGATAATVGAAPIAMPRTLAGSS